MRREVSITLDDRGNDLTFKIREMSALQLERWIMRACLVAARGGVKLPDAMDMHEVLATIQRGDFKTLLPVLSGIEVEDVQPLLDAMLAGCARVVGKAEMALTPAMVDDVISDVRTLYQLRMEILKLNFGFFIDGGPLSSPRSTSPRADGGKA